MAEGQPSLLRVDTLVTGYGKKRVVDGVSVDVAAGEVVALIGHNGAGKSTLLKAIFGMLRIWEGSVAFDGQVVGSPSPQRLLRAGVAYVPQGNRVFTDLTVRENLQLARVAMADGRELERRIAGVATMFPALQGRERQRAASLSGGEKQMLALAGAMIVSPRLLLLDEPSLGLAPPAVSETLDRVRAIAERDHVAVLIVEQKVREVLRIAHRVCVLRNGQLSYAGSAELLRDEARLRQVYL